MPAAANQAPAVNQSGILDTSRVTSTIPKAGSDDGAWVYPSPQMVLTHLSRHNDIVLSTRGRGIPDIFIAFVTNASPV